MNPKLSILFTIFFSAVLLSSPAVFNQASAEPVTKRLDVVFTMDVSGSIDSSEFSQISQAAKSFVDLMGPGDEAGIVQFAGGVVFNLPLTTSMNTVKTQLGIRYGTGGTNIPAGVDQAIQDLNNGPVGDSKVIIVFTDGYTCCTSALVSEANTAAADGYVVYAIGTPGASQTQLTALATPSGGQVFDTQSLSDLQNTYKQVFTTILQNHPPTLTITTPANNTETNSGTVTVSGTSSDYASISSVTWKVDSGTVSTATGTTWWSFNTGTLPDGTHTIYVNSTDSVGIVTQEHVDITVDTIPPTTGASLSGTTGENNWYTSPVKVTLAASDNSGGSGVKTTTYSLDGGSQTTYSLPFTVSGDSNHTMIFNSTDNAGNVETVHTLYIPIDTTKPVITVPSDITVYSTGPTGTAVTFSDTNGTAASATDATSGVDTITYSPTSDSTFPIGNTTVTVTATDKAGNSATGTFTVTVKSTLHQKISNIVSSLQALNPTDKGDSHALDDAEKKLAASTDPKLWQSDNALNPKGGEKVFDFEKQSVKKLMDIIKHGKESTAFDGIIQTAINDTVTVDDTIASHAIDNAGAIHDKDAQHKVLDAQKEMQKASDEIAKGHYDNAIDHYKNAWKKAEQAIKKD